jgi:hypothetical protein
MLEEQSAPFEYFHPTSTYFHYFRRATKQVLGARGFSFVAPTTLPIVFMDTRTQRLLRPDAAPGLLDGAGFADLVNLIKSTGGDADTPLLVVAPCPVIGYEPAEGYLRPKFGAPLDFSRDPESWSFDPATYLKLFQTIESCRRRRVVFFSGDVHYGFAATARFQETSATTDIVQLTSSALWNEPSGKAYAALAVAGTVHWGTSAATDTAGWYELTQAGLPPRTTYEAGVGGNAPIDSIPANAVGRQLAGMTMTYLNSDGMAIPYKANNFGIVRITWSGPIQVFQQLRGASAIGTAVNVTFP